jgi:hypothetical protein
MILEDLRKRMMACRQAADEQASELKDPYLALAMLSDFYRQLETDEGGMASVVLCEWALSDDEALRFDALAMIDEFEVAAALPALQQLLKRLGSSSAPGAFYETQKVKRILARLSKGPLPKGG